MPYNFHLHRNTADLLRNVNGEVPLVFQVVILSTFQLLTELLVVVFILGLLLVTAPTSTLTATVILGASVFIFFTVLRTKISGLGKEQQEVSGTMIKWVKDRKSVV